MTVSFSLRQEISHSWYCSVIRFVSAGLIRQHQPAQSAPAASTTCKEDLRILPLWCSLHLAVGTKYFCHKEWILLRHSPLRVVLISNLIVHVNQRNHSKSTYNRGDKTNLLICHKSIMTHFLSSDPWNQLHDGMQLYHNHFRDTFNDIYSRSENIESEDAGELSNFLAYAYSLYRHLDAHHSI